MNMTNTQIHISRKNRSAAWMHFWPEGNGKAKPNHVLHHKDMSLKANDIDRYIQWNIEDLEMLTRKEHFNLHKIPGWNKGMRGGTSKFKGMTWEDMYGAEKAAEMKVKLSEAQSGLHNHNYGKPNWNSGKVMPKEMYATRSKKIAQYTLDGNLIAVYNSTRDAERMTGFAHNNISRCANGKCKQMNGYVWKFITT